MSTLEKLSELEALRLAIQTGVSEEANKALTTKGKLGARGRITQLLDENSFVEIGAFIKSRSTAFNMDVMDTPADGVVCGYGTVNGSLVYVYSQDPTVLGGALGEMHGKKIVKTYEDALKVGAPVIGFIDTVGIRLQEHVDALAAYGDIYAKMSQAKGRIPQITVICGDCGGGASILSGLSDFTFISTKNGQLYLNSPNTLEDKEATFDTVSKATVHLEQSGMASFGSEKEEELIEKVRTLLSYLPANEFENVPCYPCMDDLNRSETALNTFDFASGDIKDIIKAVVDGGEYLEIWQGYGKDTFTAYTRLNGATVGIVANVQSVMTLNGAKKATEFVNTCNHFGIPLVTFTNIERFESTVETERQGMSYAISKLTLAFATAEVAKVNVILNNAFGSAYTVMNSKSIGADCVYAWPNAQISTLPASSAVRIMYEEELKKAEVSQDYLAEKVAQFEQENTSSFAAAARGYVDDLIEPAATRKRVIAALEMLYTK
jgi:acetyl-CoA carboxylase carboxyltransferase component